MDQTWAIPEEGGIYSDLILIDNITIIKNGAVLNINSPKDNHKFGDSFPFFNISIQKN